ncbi:hypothetical protein ACFL6I_24990, partial [candidate division KSB1 bacterium]
PTRLDKLMNASGHQQYDRGDTLYEQFDNTADETAFIIRTIQNLRGKAFKDKNESEERGLDADCRVRREKILRQFRYFQS